MKIGKWKTWRSNNICQKSQTCPEASMFIFFWTTGQSAQLYKSFQIGALPLLIRTLSTCWAWRIFIMRVSLGIFVGSRWHCPFPQIHRLLEKWPLWFLIILLDYRVCTPVFAGEMAPWFVLVLLDYQTCSRLFFLVTGKMTPGISLPQGNSCLCKKRTCWGKLHSNCTRSSDPVCWPQFAGR